MFISVILCTLLIFIKKGSRSLVLAIHSRKQNLFSQKLTLINLKKPQQIKMRNNFFVENRKINQNYKTVIFYKLGIIQYSNKKKKITQMDKHTWHRAHLNIQSNNLPAPRWGHSCCVIGNQIIYFGGYAQSVYMNDVWSFNTTTMQWTEIKTTGDIPSHRSNCSMSYDSQNDRIIVFGGGGPNKKRFNSINILNWMTKQWIEIHPKENQAAPWQRTYHCAQLLYPYLVVFGGEGVADMDDLWIFNFETFSWKQLNIDKSKPRPCGRRFHSSAVIGNQFYIIGGCHGKYRCLSDVFSLDFTPLLKDNDVQRLEWKDRKPLGSAFLTRWGHSSCVYDNKIYIFGGRFSNDLNDLLVLDTQRNTIKALKISSQLPKARRRHSACFIGSCMIIFGGFNGQYYNDLYYINTFQLRTRLQIPSSTYGKNISNLVNNKSLSDLQIKTSTNQTFYLHKGLLINGLKSEDNIYKFVENIDNKLEKQVLQQLIAKIYRGYGTLTIQQINYGVDLPDSQQQYQQIIKNQLLKQCTQKQLPPSSSLLKKKNLLPLIIQLNDDQFSSFLDQNRQFTYKDSAIIIVIKNQEYLLQTNSVALSANSMFFRSAFSGKFKDSSKIDNIKQIRLTLNSNNLVVFEIALNYLLLDKLIVPIDMGLVSWMQLYEMADYFCIQRLMIICQQQICGIVNEHNCDQILSFSLEMQMQTLSLHCADFLIKCMVNRQDKFFYQETNCQSKNTVLQMMYNLSRFDILQVKLERMKIIEDRLKKKQSLSTQDQDDKQNYETNHINDP